MVTVTMMPIKAKYFLGGKEIQKSMKYNKKNVNKN